MHTVIGNTVFMTGAESHSSLTGMLDGTDVPGGLKLIATLNKYVSDMRDHGVFRRNDVLYLFFSCGRWAHYHEPTDTPDRLNYRKMARITRLAVRLLVQADAGLRVGMPAFLPRAALSPGFEVGWRS